MIFMANPRSVSRHSYIHYGADELKPELVGPVKNDGGIVGKPSGVGTLWATPILDAGSDWKEYAEEWHDRDFSKSFKFHLKNPERIFVIDSEESLTKVRSLYERQWPSYIPRRLVTPEDDPVYLDFEKMARDGWDGVEVLMCSYPKLYWHFYGWDVDSLAIWNAEQIVVEKPREEHDDILSLVKGDHNFKEAMTLYSGDFTKWLKLRSSRD
jgi:hypothetical protein